MNKKELIKSVVDKKPYRTRAGEVEEIVNATLEAIQTALANGDDVKLAGFGSFVLEHKDARPARNPRTGETVQVPPRTVVKFRPAKALKESVDQ